MFLLFLLFVFEPKKKLQPNTNKKTKTIPTNKTTNNNKLKINFKKIK